MNKHEEIIAKLKDQDLAEAERWEEEIDIILHKLKFLPREAIPTVCILDQRNNFLSLNSMLIKEKVEISGGLFTENLTENTDILIIRQRDENLYSLIPTFIEQKGKLKAIANNNVYIIQANQFNENESSYLQDLEILAEIIQPKYFVFGRSGQDWLKFELA